MESNFFESYLMPTLTVSNCEAAVMFYKAAFDAVEEFSNLETQGSGLAILRIGAALLVVADESPAHGIIDPFGHHWEIGRPLKTKLHGA